MATISKIHARQILDSRGNPTVEAVVTLDNDVFASACVPSGASTGSKEALELRDGNKDNYLGKSVHLAISNIKEKIQPALLGKSIFDQKTIDTIMLDIDGTEFKRNLGANATLAVSLACARAGALAKGKHLYSYLREDLICPQFKSETLLPSPLMNIINGGEHASNNLDIQEFMIVPHLRKPFSENLRAGVEVFHSLKKVLTDKGHSTNVGDEGGFAPMLESHEEAIDLILNAIKAAGYEPGRDISISLDSASSEFFKDGAYHMQGKILSSEEMVQYYSELVSKYPIYSIEDGLDENDLEGWKKLTSALGDQVKLVGDDLFVTNEKILKRGIENKEANAILVKVNQIGTLTETFSAMDLAFKNNFIAIISHRSGETGDHFIADLAVATSSAHIKTGSASRSDRMEKYNQLLRIEEHLGEQAKYLPIK
jgi:enolase